MRNFLVVFLIIVGFSFGAAAHSEHGDGFYVGVDPAKTNSKIGNVNNAVSLDGKVAEDRYYGYKFSSYGFFVAPELFMQNGATGISATQNSSSNANSIAASNSGSANSIGPLPGITYNVKANVGYEFNRYVSGFLTYDLGSFAYSSGSGNRQMAVGANRANNSAVGIGSQINLSDSFGVKFMYSQQQFENSAVSGGRIRSDVVKVGTVYSF